MTIRKILVADDEIKITNLIKIDLEKQGYQVETANSTAEARQKFETFEPDLTITDNLDGGGIAFAVELHEAALAVIVISSAEIPIGIPAVQKPDLGQLYTEIQILETI